MRYIRKGAEPQLHLKEETGPMTTLSQWRQGTAGLVPGTWGDLLNPMKKELHEALLREQGYLCCYCGIQVEQGTQVPANAQSRGKDVEGSHIEHLLPREHFSELMFDYDNLAISCQGRQDVPREPSHCGAHKGNWPHPAERALFLSPTDPNCESKFRYTSDGKILPASDDPIDSAAAKMTIDKLRLYHSRLEKHREIVIDELEHELDTCATDDERQALACGYLDEVPEAAKRYRLTPFLQVIQYHLRRYGYG